MFINNVLTNEVTKMNEKETGFCFEMYSVGYLLQRKLTELVDDIIEEPSNYKSINVLNLLEEEVFFTVRDSIRCAMTKYQIELENIRRGAVVDILFWSIFDICIKYKGVDDKLSDNDESYIDNEFRAAIKSMLKEEGLIA